MKARSGPGQLRDAVENVVEPYLLQQGYVLRTPRGRVAGGKAYEHLGLKTPQAKPPRGGLFEE